MLYNDGNAEGPMHSFISFFILFVAISYANTYEPIHVINISLGQGDAPLIEGPTKDRKPLIQVLIYAGDIGNQDMVEI